MKVGKHTAQEIVQAAGFEEVEFGSDRVRIGGIRGIVKAGQKVNIQPDTSEVEVMVGNETKTVSIE